MTETRQRNLPLVPPEAETSSRLRYEEYAWKMGFRHVAGVDEAGRGPLAGPVVAAAVILNPEYIIEGLKDSKQLSPEKRRQLFSVIRMNALAIGVGIIYQDRIDSVNILNAALEAMALAVSRLQIAPDFLLVDGNFPTPVKLPQKAIVHGDSLSLSISAASIVAKVVRDQRMEHYHKKFPHYNFLSNKGYATKEHMKAIARFGVCPIHRKTFRRVKEFMETPPLFDHSY